MKSKIAEFVMLFAIFCLFVFSVLDDNKILVLLTVLAFALTLKTMKTHGKISVFIFGFLFLFSLPLLSINQRDVSDDENRGLKPSPKLVIDNSLNTAYPAQFGDYLEDRFFCRNQLSKLVQNFKCSINTTTCGKDVFLNKKSGWTYVKGFLPAENINSDLIRQNLKKLSTFATKNGMQLYVLIIPTKGVIYPEAVYPNIPVILDYKKMFGEPVVYPYNELLTAKKSDFVMPKYDEHWTEYGAFIGYQALMKYIQKKNPSLKILSESDFVVKKQNTIRTMIPYNFSYGYNAKTFGIKEPSELYKTYSFPQEDLLSIKIDKETNDFVSKFSASKNPQRLYLIGSLYSDNLSLFLRYSFSEIKKVNCLSKELQSDDLRMNLYEKDILNFKPDILLVAITVAAVPALEVMYESEDENAF